MRLTGGTTNRSLIAFAFVTSLGLAGAALSKKTAASDTRAKSESPPTEFGRPSQLPAPSRLSVSQFEEKLFEFLNSRQYRQLGWIRDKAVRDTGSFIGGKYYGTHPAVRVYYSPGVIKWLVNGRVGKIPDGE